MNAAARVRMVVVDPGRWHGAHADLPADVLIDGVPPAAIVVVVRELRQGGRSGPGVRDRGATRDRAVLCRYVAEVGDQVFYAPVPGQHSEDESWPHAGRAILTIEGVGDVS